MSGTGNIITGAIVATFLGVLLCIGVGIKICMGAESARKRNSNLQ
jgi:flagellar motor component MotA